MDAQMIANLSHMHGLPVRLVKAIILTESSDNTWAVRYEPHWRWFFSPKQWARRLKITDKTERSLQANSWGLMQIMGATARELGFTRPLVRLCEPMLGVEYGCRYLKKQLDRYSGDVYKAVAAYNAGSARRSVLHPSKFKNQVYVDKVMKHFTEVGPCL